MINEFKEVKENNKFVVNKLNQNEQNNNFMINEFKQVKENMSQMMKNIELMFNKLQNSKQFIAHQNNNASKIIPPNPNSED